MKVLHLIGGKEVAGSKNHLLSLLKNFNKEEVVLGVFEKGAIFTEAEKLGIDVRYLGQKTRYDLSVIYKIKKLIRSETVSILHTHGPRANLYGYLVRKTENIIWTTTVHSDPRYDFIGRGLKGKLFTIINLRVLKKVHHCFAISNRFSKMLRDLNVNCRITTIYNGISFSETQQDFFSEAELNLTKKDFVIIMVGRLHPIKGHVVVFEAIKNLQVKIPNLKLLIVGDGPIEEELKRKVTTYKIAEQVSFLGFQPEKKIHSLLKLSDVFVLSSYSESFPLVILEASRAKIPVISTDVGGVKDLIIDHSLGWVIPPKDAESLEKAIFNAYELKDELGIIGINLYEKAAKNYSVKQLFEAVNSAYRELLAEKNNNIIDVP
ncbi:glycosyltransferase family 4 protein [Bacillaceae bacterium IKA-2]|nr:glycosyltransferase family 4 protein [Bacillaceae bacterium IKA-2]